MSNSNQPYTKLVSSFNGDEKKSEPDIGTADNWQKITRPLNAVSKWCDYVSSRRKILKKKFSKEAVTQREGPAPKGEQRRKGMFENLNSTHQGIDSDMNDEEDDESIDLSKSFTSDMTSSIGVKNSEIKSAKATPNSRALIYYFSKLAGSSNMEDVVDLDFVEGLIDNGADINVCDKHGQTIFHEVARAWHIDVAKFLIEKNADVNKADKFGRTPIHVASAVNYPEMVKFLFENGGEHHIDKFLIFFPTIFMIMKS